MLGAIFGDLVGSVFEEKNILDPVKTMDFPLFCPESRPTDDTVLTVAIAEAFLGNIPFDVSLRKWARRYPNAGYGSSFFEWMHSEEPEPYNSWGNGSAMRVSPAAWSLPVSASLGEVLAVAKRTAEITHNHPEGIDGAQAVALAIHLARQGSTAEEIRTAVGGFFPEYNLERTIDEIRPEYFFDVSCRGSVPEAILCAIEGTSVEHAVRLAVSLGGDADTQACIAGAIAEARFGVPLDLEAQIKAILPADMKAVLFAFTARYIAVDRSLTAPA